MRVYQVTISQKRTNGSLHEFGTYFVRGDSLSRVMEVARNYAKKDGCRWPQVTQVTYVGKTIN